MFRHVRSLAFVASLIAVARPSAAQLREVQPGARVQFTGNGVGSRVTALVLERHGDTIKVIRGNSSPFEVRMSELSTLRISQGKSRSAGAAVGALWGAGVNVFSVIVLVATGADCGDCQTDVDGAALGLSIVSGALTGALIGALIGREHWSDVSLPMRATLRPTLGRELLGGGATGQRLGLKVTLAFGGA